MADKIALDPEKLERDAKVLEAVGNEIDGTADHVQSVTYSYDPGGSGSDAVVHEIDGQYWEVAYAMVDNARLLSTLITDIAQLVISVARDGESSEEALKLLNEEYDIFVKNSGLLVDASMQFADRSPSSGNVVT